MKRIFCIIILMLVCMIMADTASAKVIRVKSLSSGMYEDGVFTPVKSGFEAEYVIDVSGEKVILDRIIMNDREGKINEGDAYEITNEMLSEGLSSLVVSRNKMGQKIITAVREAGLGASEIIMIGKDFYEFCRADNGKFYLEYGEAAIAE